MANLRRKLPGKCKKNEGRQDSSTELCRPSTLQWA